MNEVSVRMLHIVMDTAGDIPSDWLVKYNIHTIPTNIQFGDKTYLQGIDISNEEFYRLAEESGTIPKTSQPTPKQFVDFYKRIANYGDTILSIHVTGKLSGTYHSAQLAARELQSDMNVIPFDSASGTAVMGYMCRDARRLERAGVSIQNIIKRLDRIRKDVKIVFTLNTLEYARMSGRIKALQAALASILNIKPVVDLKDGFLNVIDRVRTRHRSMEYLLDYMVERFGETLVYAAVVHARDPDTGLLLLKRVEDVLNCCDLILTELSIGVAANLGPGTIGIVAYPVEKG